MPTPSILSVSPGSAFPGEQVVISGSNFENTDSISFGSIVCNSNSFTVNSEGTQLTATVPAISSGTSCPANESVVVTASGLESSNPVSLTIENPPVLNTITLKNNTALDSSKYTVWVAGFIQQPDLYLFLNTDGNFTSDAGNYINITDGMTVNVPNVTNLGNNRLVFLITENTTAPPALSPTVGYTAYPFNAAPGVCPPGPYDIFEFGPNAQYDVSAVDSFGLNLSFTVSGDNLTYGAIPAISRPEIAEAFTAFTGSDPLGSAFTVLLYTSPTGTGYPDSIMGQFSAIVSPKDWLAINSGTNGLSDYWSDTITDFFTSGNQLNIYLNAATVGTYSGTSDGTQYTLTGPNGLTVTIPANDFTGNQGFMQAVRGMKPGEAQNEYDAFSQIEAAIFQAISRGVLLDGVVAEGGTISDGYTSTAWTNIQNWYSNHNNAYNQNPSVYDVYAKFFHCAKNHGGIIMGLNSAQSLGMAYGFSLDENPNVGSWSAGNNVPSKTNYSVGSGQDVTLTIGRWIPAS